MRRGAAFAVKRAAPAAARPSAAASSSAATSGVAGVRRVVREHYLRDDVACGCDTCETCDRETTRPVIIAAEALVSPLYDTRHVVLPTADVVLRQIDLLEHVFFHDVVVLETVLDDVKLRASDVYERVRALVGNPTRRFFVFLNEHSSETFAERGKDEAAEARARRAVHKAAQWYHEHLAACSLEAVLLTADEAACEAAREAGCAAATVAAYVDAITNLPELRDVLARASDDFAGDAQGNYAEHIDQDKIELGLKTKEYEKGSFSISPYDRNEALVWVQGVDMRVIIEGEDNMNRAVHEDQVVIEILPREQWQHPSAKADAKGDKNAGSIALTINEPIMNDQVSQPTGRVVAVLKRKWRPYCGSLAADAEPREDGSVLFVPVDRRIPRVWIRTRQAEALRGKRIVACIDAWPMTSRQPCGHFVRTIGDIGDKFTESEVIMIEHDIPHEEFSHAVLACLPSQGDKWTVCKHGGNDERRRDLRHLVVCSVDPPGCTDIDDALHVRPLENGNYEVGVHIADVTYFVRPGTAMDQEAARRGTTVYLVDKRIDMLPMLLGTNLCSLRCDVDRFAFSCLWEMTPEGEVVSVDFCKSTINSRASLQYDDAQRMIDDPDASDDLAVSIKTLNKLARKLNAQRRCKGALALASPEVKVALERDSQNPVDVEMKEMKEANSMVEEFMLLANISVAAKIYEVFQQCSLLRRHAQPAASRFDYLIASAQSQGLTIDPTNSKTLAESLDKALVADKPYLNRLIRILTTRCMTQAQYICSGKFSTDQFYHYGLAASIYTHFTSPIRRYADVVVHRLLAAAVDADTTFPEMLDKDVIHRVCRNLNKRHKLAQYSGRASVQLYTVLYFRDRSVVEEAHIIRVLQNGLVVLVPQYGIEGVVTIVPSDEPNVTTFEYDAVTNQLRSKSLRVTFRLFDRVRVLVRTDESDPLQLRIELCLVHPHVPGVSVNAPASSERAAGKRAAIANYDAGADDAPPPLKKPKKKKKTRDVE